MAELMTLEEAADYLWVTRKTACRLVERHGIPSTKVRHLQRLDRDEVDAWLRNSWSPEFLSLRTTSPSVICFVTLSNGPATMSRPLPSL